MPLPWLLLKKILYANVKENTTKNHSSYSQDVVKGTKFTLLLKHQNKKTKKKGGKKENKTTKTCKNNCEELDIR